MSFMRPVTCLRHNSLLVDYNLIDHQRGAVKAHPHTSLYAGSGHKSALELADFRGRISQFLLNGKILVADLSKRTL